MTIVPSGKQVAAITQLAQLLLSPSAKQRSKRRIAPPCDPTRFTDEAVAMLSDRLDKKLLQNMGDGIQVYDVKRPS